MPLPEVHLVGGTSAEAARLAPVATAMREQARVEPILIAAGPEPLTFAQTLAAFGLTAGLAVPAAADDTETICRLDQLWASRTPAAVVVQGDTGASLPAAIAAYWRRIPVVHLDAGRRSADLGATGLAEPHRRLLTQVSTLHLAATPLAAMNLLDERVPGGDVLLTGNTAVDAALAVRDHRPPFADPAVAALREPATPTGTVRTPTSPTSTVRTPTSPTSTVRTPTSPTATVHEPTTPTGTVCKPNSPTGTVREPTSPMAAARKGAPPTTAAREATSPTARPTATTPNRLLLVGLKQTEGIGLKPIERLASEHTDRLGAEHTNGLGAKHTDGVRLEHTDGVRLEMVRAAVRRLAARFPDLDVIMLGAEPSGCSRRVIGAGPLAYADRARLLAEAYLVLTDDGDLQEEALAFGVPALILHEMTDRMEPLHAGCARLVGPDLDSLLTDVAELLDSRVRRDAMTATGNPYGDGLAAQRAAQATAALLGHGTFPEPMPARPQAGVSR